MARGCWLQVRVSADEEAAVKRAASEAGLDVSAFVRERVLAPAEPRTLPELQEAAQVRRGYRQPTSNLDIFRSIR